MPIEMPDIRAKDEWCSTRDQITFWRSPVHVDRRAIDLPFHDESHGWLSQIFERGDFVRMCGA